MHAGASIVTWTRFIAAWAFTLVVSLVACIGMMLVGPERFWCIIRPFWAKNTLRIVGVRLRLEGAEHLRGPAIFISNHQSLIDVVFLPAILPPETKIVAKRELMWIPLWGWGFALGGAILIDRHRPRQALEDIVAGVRRMPARWSLTIFPEGTRPRDGMMKPFKRGAFYVAASTHLPLVPIGMDGAREIVPPGSWLVRGGEVRIVVGAPIDTTLWDDPNAWQRYAAIGHAAVAACVTRARAGASGDSLGLATKGEPSQ